MSAEKLSIQLSLQESKEQKESRCSIMLEKLDELNEYLNEKAKNLPLNSQIINKIKFIQENIQIIKSLKNNQDPENAIHCKQIVEKIKDAMTCRMKENQSELTADLQPKSQTNNPSNSSTNNEKKESMDDKQVQLMKQLQAHFVYMLETGTFNQYLLAILHEFEFAERESQSHAFELYQQCAKQNFVLAQYTVGKCYEEGRLIPKNYSFAYDWLEKAASQGYSKAQYYLAFFYEKGLGTEKNVERYMELLELARRGGVAQATQELAICYYNGRCVEQDVALGIKLYKEAADQNCAHAQYLLAKMHFKRTPLIPLDDKTAAELMRKAAIQGEPSALYFVAGYYESGVYNFQKDPALAMHYYKQAEKRGSIAAQQRVHRLIHGKNKKNEFIHDITLASLDIKDYPHPISIYNLCFMRFALSEDFLKGINYSSEIISPDIKRAWLIVIETFSGDSSPLNAAARNSILFKYETIKEKLSLVENAHLYEVSQFESLKEIIEYFEKIATPFSGSQSENNSAEALLKKAHALDALGFCYQMGYGKKRNLNKAVKCYEEAISLGLTSSYFYLYLCYRQYYLMYHGDFELAPFINLNANENEKYENLPIKNLISFLNKYIEEPKEEIQKLHIEAIIMAAEIYERGVCGIPVNLEYAFKLYEKAFNLNPDHPLARQKSGNLNHLNILHNTVNALHFTWQNGAESGFPPAIASLISEYAFDETAMAAGEQAGVKSNSNTGILATIRNWLPF